MSSTSTVTTLSDITARYSTLRLQVSDEGKTRLSGPIQNQGSLDSFKHHELSSNIGREYGPDFQLRDLLEADDTILRDFASVGKSTCDLPLPGRLSS